MANFTPQEIEQFLQDFFDVVGTRQYTGARYVPIFGRKGESSIEWDNSEPYEPLTVVMHNGASYVSRQYVPAGINIYNTDFWAQTYQFNAQIETYRREVAVLDDEVSDLRDYLESDYVPFPVGASKYGTNGQVLSTNGLGQTNWANPVAPTDAQAEEYITAWLNAHPEATTTVLDNSVTDEKLVQSGGILSTVKNLMVSGAGLGNEVIEQYNTKFVDYVYQYVDNETNVTGEIYDYNATLDEIQIVTAAQFGRALPFVLGAGEYSSKLYGFFAGQSYIKDSTGYHKFRDVFTTVNSNGLGDFTVTEPTTFYISLGQSWKLCIFVNKNNIITTYTSEHIYKRYYYCKFKNTKIDASDVENLATNVNYTNLEQAFIKEGVLTCNNDHPNASTSVAKYTKADLGSDIRKFMCRGVFATLSNNSSITLIATKHDSNTTVQDIVQESIHIGFNGVNCILEIYNNSVRTSYGTFNYTIQANTEYEFGWSISGNTITLYLPDGTTQTVTDASFSSFNGRYAIFEHFSYQTTPTLEPTDDFGQAKISGIYITCASGKPLRDNFKCRPNGLPYAAPTGHVYTQFRNGATGDTVYDAGSGTVN